MASSKSTMNHQESFTTPLNMLMFNDIIYQGIPTIIFTAGLIALVLRNRENISSATILERLGLNSTALKGRADTGIICVVGFLCIALWNAFMKTTKVTLWNYWNKKVQESMDLRKHMLLESFWNWRWWTSKRAGDGEGCFRGSSDGVSSCSDNPLPLDPEWLTWIVFTGFATLFLLFVSYEYLFMIRESEDDFDARSRGTKNSLAHDSVAPESHTKFNEATDEKVKGGVGEVIEY